MAKNSTGRHSTADCMRIEMRHLVKNGCISKGRKVESILSWKDCSIKVLTDFTRNEKSIRLIYEVLYPTTGVKEFIDYKILRAKSSQIIKH